MTTPTFTAVPNLPRAPRVVGTRELSAITMWVVHCDGRERLQEDDELAVIRQHARYHIQKNWARPGRPPAYGDGLMYHFVMGERAIYQTRDLREVTWHATGANPIAGGIMLFCGFKQAPGPGALANLERLLDWLCYERPDIPAGRKDVFGHGELTQHGNATQCPGGELLNWTRGYRAGSRKTPDYPFEGPPTISVGVFGEQLARRGSPALAEHTAAELYNTIVEYGINPAVALAFFAKESEFGTYAHSPAKVLIEARNWGNLRPAAALLGMPGSRATGIVDSGIYWHFAKFASWVEGLRAWCEYMLRRYPGQTVGQLLQVYAPRSDGNDPDGYARAVNEWVANWQQQSGL